MTTPSAGRRLIDGSSLGAPGPSGAPPPASSAAGAVTTARTADTKQDDDGWLLWGLLIMAGFSVAGLLITHRHGIRYSIRGDIYAVAVSGVSLFFVVHFIRVARARRTSLAFVVTAFLAILTTLLAQYSLLYYRLGGLPNWNVDLTKGEAIYVTVGTLTTGAGGITPESESARIAVMSQQAVDLLIVTVVLAFAVERFRHRRIRDAAAQAAPTSPPERPSDYGF